MTPGPKKPYQPLEPPPPGPLLGHPGDPMRQRVPLTPREAIERGRELLSRLGGLQFPEEPALGDYPAWQRGPTSPAGEWDRWLRETLRRIEKLNSELNRAGVPYRLVPQRVELSPRLEASRLLVELKPRETP